MKGKKGRRGRKKEGKKVGGETKKDRVRGKKKDSRKRSEPN